MFNEIPEIEEFEFDENEIELNDLRASSARVTAQDDYVQRSISRFASITRADRLRH